MKTLKFLVILELFTFVLSSCTTSSTSSTASTKAIKEAKTELMSEKLRLTKKYSLMLEGYLDTIKKYKKVYRSEGKNLQDIMPEWRQELYKKALSHHDVIALKNEFLRKFGEREYYLLEETFQWLRYEKLKSLRVNL
jgi:hypothetical protein